LTRLSSSTLPIPSSPTPLNTNRRNGGEETWVKRPNAPLPKRVRSGVGTLFITPVVVNSSWHNGQREGVNRPSEIFQNHQNLGGESGI
jgi:hypothetical protein